MFTFYKSIFLIPHPNYFKFLPSLYFQNWFFLILIMLIISFSFMFYYYFFTKPDLDAMKRFAKYHLYSFLVTFIISLLILKMINLKFLVILVISLLFDYILINLIIYILLMLISRLPIYNKYWGIRAMRKYPFTFSFNKKGG